MIWSDYLLCLVAARGGGSMTYEIIGNSVLGKISNDSAFDIAVVDIAAFEIAALDNAARAAGTRPLARAPDNPSSTR
jgi:hypothetical protein